jgi:hypothetical protein
MVTGRRETARTFTLEKSGCPRDVYDLLSQGSPLRHVLDARHELRVRETAKVAWAKAATVS